MKVSFRAFLQRLTTYPVLIPIMLIYATVHNKELLLNVFYKVRGFGHGYFKKGLRIAKYDGLIISFPYNEDPAFDDVWIRDVYQVYSPKENHIVIDVGAHMGFFTLKVVKDVMQVIAVEPDPINFKFLKYNIIINGMEKKVRLSNIALGGRNDKIFLDRSAYGYGRSKSTFNKTEYSIKMHTLDTLVEEKKLKSVSLIKIDTEGFELEILKGAITTLHKYKPNLIIAAYHFPQEFLEINEFLRKQGYLVFFYYMPLFLFGGKEIYLYARHN